MLDDFFTFVLDMKLDAATDPSELYHQAEAQLKTAMRETAAAGFDAQQQEATKLALISFLDESVMRSIWQRKREWPLLQYHLLDGHCAGSSFFEKFSLIDRESDPDVTEIFHYCLGLNYRGRLGVASSEEREAYLEKMRAEINARTTPTPLAPHGDAQPFGRLDPGGQPWWVWMASGVVLLVTILLVSVFILP